MEVGRVKLKCSKCGGEATRQDGVQGDNVVDVKVCQSVKCGWTQVIR